MSTSAMGTSLAQAGCIFLYGPSGSGKSSLGPRLAQALNLPFIDLDGEIVSQAGRTIPDIFAQEGESGFRQCERQAFEACLQGGQSVMALFRQIAREKGSAVICVTHDQRMIEGFDHIYHVNDGRVSNG